MTIQDLEDLLKGIRNFCDEQICSKCYLHDYCERADMRLAGTIIEVQENLHQAVPARCYFCGAQTEINVRCTTGEDSSYFVFCPKCCARGPMSKSKKEAVEKWNKAIK